MIHCISIRTLPAASRFIIATPLENKEIFTMNQLTKLTLAIVATLSFLTPALANDAHHVSASTKTSVAATAMTDGEIKKVDKNAGKLTIKHGPIANLEMPNMTMVFRVKDPAMLDRVKAGDKVKFAADKVNGAITITEIEVAK
jgi:Cu(I)/Ag(I) efflux system protein CusF